MGNQLVQFAVITVMTEEEEEEEGNIFNQATFKIKPILCGLLNLD